MQKARRAAQPCAIQLLESRRLLSAVALDLNFGVNDRVSSELRTDGGVGQDFVADAVLQSDGKLLIAAASDSNPYLVRYNSNGTRDTSFAPRGQIALPKQGLTNYSRLYLLSNGKMLLTGSTSTYVGSQYNSNPLLVRLNSDGSLDSSFGSGGMVVAPGGLNSNFPGQYNSALLPDGKILISGSVYDLKNSFDDGAIWRFNSDGSLDTTFSSDGPRRYDYNDANFYISVGLVRPDGGFYAGTTKGQAKFLADGTLDTTFGTSGFVVTNAGFSLQQADGKFLGFGTIQLSPSSNDVAVYRWNLDGTPDTSFGINGRAQIDVGTQDSPSDILLDPTGKIIVGLTASGGTDPETYGDFAFARLLPNGSLDTSFGPGGTFVDPFIQFGAAYPTFVGDALRKGFLTSDGKLLAVGTTRLLSTEDPSPQQYSDNIGLSRYVPDAPFNIHVGPFGPVAEGQLFTVTDGGSTYDNGQITRFEWDYGSNGRPFLPEAQGQTAQVRAGDDPGAPIALRLTTSDGLSAIGVTHVSTFNVPPVADAGPDRVAAAGVPVQLRLVATDAVPEGGRFTVNYGDGSPNSVFNFANVENPRVVNIPHTYAQKGIYTLTLTAEDGDGGSSTDTAQVHVGDLVAHLFEDVNGYGTQDVDVDHSISGQIAWIDFNDNGLADDGEPLGVSDESGDVPFDGLAPGTYKLRTQAADGYQVTFADASIRGDACTASITASAGAVCNFGLTRRAMITGTIFNDLNSNGVRDPGESGLINKNVVAIDQSNTQIAVASTYSDGFYRIRGLVPETYRIKLSIPSDWIQTFPAGSAPYQITVSTAQTVANTDFGIVATASASGFVFEDINSDGIYNNGDRLYQVNNHIHPPQIYLDDNNNGSRESGELLFSARNDGNWSISGLAPGAHTLRLLPRPGWVQTAPANDGGISIDFAPGANVTDIRFGAHKNDLTPPHVSDFVFRYDVQPQRFELTFSEPVEITPGDLEFQLESGPFLQVDLISYDSNTNKAVFVPRGTANLADGNYRAVMDDYSDLAGNASGPAEAWPFFVLKGDLNRDRTVSIADFVTLASNFGKTNATYSDGDVNYDGEISIADFIDLGANFNKTLAAPAAPAPQAAASSVILASPDKLAIRPHHHLRRHSRLRPPMFRMRD